MMGPWHRWVARATRPVDVRPFALTRVLLSLVVFGDLLLLVRAGLVRTVFATTADGGLSPEVGADFVCGFLGPQAGPALTAVVMVCMLLVALGVGARPAGLLGVLAYAQLSMLTPMADRAIDQVVRTVLLILLFTQAHRRYTLPTALGWRPAATTTPGWIDDTLRLFLTLVYVSAAFAKIGYGTWFRFSGLPELYRIMADPTAGRLDPDRPFWRTLWPLFRVGAPLTVLMECAAPLVFTRLAPYWAVFGALMHVGIAITLNLGMFSWGMLSLYPVLFGPWLLPTLDRLEARLRGASSPASSAPRPGSSPG